MTKVNFFNSFKCAIRGIFYGISRERNLKIQVLAGFFIIIISLFLQISKIYFITILLVVFLVIILELFNKNFERLIDNISPEYNKEFGEIKDTMAGIVLFSALFSIVIGLLILYSPLMRVLREMSQNPLSIFLIFANIIVILSIIFLYKKNNAFERIEYY